MTFNLHKLIRWSNNTKHSHKKRGIPIQSTPAEILETTINTLIQTQGHCPSCGQPLNQEHLHPQQITLDILPHGNYEIVCRQCNQQRGSLYKRENTP